MRCRTALLVRDLVERLTAALGLLLASPILAAAAAAVVVEDGFPLLFRQPRMGQYGHPFLILKLRTMRSNKEGTAITARGDARVTRTGAILRKFKLDEIPQLWNVCRGDMSLIGPRPEVLQFVDAANPVWMSILSVKPGITDLATLVFRNEEELLSGAADPEQFYREAILPRKLAINLRHLSSRSVRTDVKILLFTVLCSLMAGRFEPGFLKREFASMEKI